MAAPPTCKSHVCELGPTSEPGCRGANCLLSHGSTDTLKKSVSWGLGSPERKSGSLELRGAHLTSGHLLLPPLLRRSTADATLPGALPAAPSMLLQLWHELRALAAMAMTAARSHGHNNDGGVRGPHRPRPVRRFARHSLPMAGMPNSPLAMARGPSSPRAAMAGGPSLLRAAMAGRPSLPRAMAREDKEAVVTRRGGDNHGC